MFSATSSKLTHISGDPTLLSLVLQWTYCPCLLAARLRRCPTLSDPVLWKNWMEAYLGCSLQMKTLFPGWPIMVHDMHTRRTRTRRRSEFTYAAEWWPSFAVSSRPISSGAASYDLTAVLCQRNDDIIVFFTYLPLRFNDSVALKEVKLTLLSDECPCQYETDARYRKKVWEWTGSSGREGSCSETPSCAASTQWNLPWPLGRVCVCR